MRRAIAIALLCSCYAPTYRAGGACDTVCPGDLVCIDNICREPGYVPMHDAAVDATTIPLHDAALPDGFVPVDTDGDGVFDHEDSCPAIPNADQHDEDGDDIGDPCDPCPHLSGTAADADGDGVGDACDPQPGVAKQSITFFDPFTTTRPEWQLGAEYTRTGGQLRFNGGAGVARLAVATGDVRIVTGGTVASISASTPRSLSVETAFSNDGNTYYYGNFYENGDGTSIHVTRAINNTFTTITGATGPSSAFPTGAFMMQYDSRVSTQTVAILSTLGGVNYPVQTGSAGSPGLVTDDEIIIYSRNVQFRFDYFLVISTVP